MLIEDLLLQYPKTKTLKSGDQITLRPLKAEDRASLQEYFFQELNDEDVALMKDNVRDPKVIESWCKNINYERILPLIALHDSKIVAVSTLHMREFGWSKYVGKVRLTVSKNWRRKGISRILLSEIEDIANKLLLERLWAEIVVGAQDAAIKAFEKAGYTRKAQLKRLAVDPQGNQYDIAIYIKELVPY